MIEGAKYDIASAVSGNLHVMHSFTWGNAAAPPSYHLGLTYMDPSVRLLQSAVYLSTMTNLTDFEQNRRKSKDKWIILALL